MSVCFACGDQLEVDVWAPRDWYRFAATLRGDR